MRVSRGFFVILNILWILILFSCSNYQSDLIVVEKLLVTDPQTADSVLMSLPMPKSQRDNALYAILKTQIDYELGRPFSSDSLIITATDYYGSRRKSYHAALAWYSQGCVYSRMKNNHAAIYAYLKAKDLFPDTLVRYYALTEKNLGSRYYEKKMYDCAYDEFCKCRINADRIQDSSLSHYASVFSVLSRIQDPNIQNTDNQMSQFSLILNEVSETENARTDTLFKIPKDNSSSFENSSDTTFRVVTIKSMLLHGERQSNQIPPISPDAYYNMKATSLYYSGDFDSAYIYFKKSIPGTSDANARIMIYDRLAEISAKKGNAAEVLIWHQRYSELRDSIEMVKQSDSREIMDLQYLHKEELKEEKMQGRHKRFVLICIFSFIAITIITVLIYVLFKNREKKRIIEKQEEFIRLEQEIRRSSISILESRVREQSQTDPEARAVLMNLYRHRIEINKEYFYKSEAFRTLTSNSLGQELDSSKKTMVIETIKHSFSDTIADMQIEYPGIDTEESLTLLLSAMHFKNELVAKLLGNVTADAIRKRKYRFSKRNPDYYSLFC